MDFTYVLKDSYTIDSAKLEQVSNGVKRDEDAVARVMANLMEGESITFHSAPLPENEVEIRPYEIYKGEKLIQKGSLPGDITDDEIPNYMNNIFQCLNEVEKQEEQNKINEIERKQKLLLDHQIDTELEDMQKKVINLPNGWPVSFIVDKETPLEMLKQIEECSKYTLDEVIAMNTHTDIHPDAPLPPDAPAEPFAWMILKEEREKDSNSDSE